MHVSINLSDSRSQVSRKIIIMNDWRLKLYTIRRMCVLLELPALSSWNSSLFSFYFVLLRTLPASIGQHVICKARRDRFLINRNNWSQLWSFESFQTMTRSLGDTCWATSKPFRLLNKLLRIVHTIDSSTRQSQSSDFLRPRSKFNAIFLNLTKKFVCGLNFRRELIAPFSVLSLF